MVKIEGEIALSLAVSKITNIFNQPIKIQQNQKFWKNFSFVYYIIYTLKGPNWAQNCCISYRFWDNRHFLQSKSSKIIYPKGSKMRSKSLYHLLFLRYLHFKNFRKISRWPPNLKILKIFLHPIVYSLYPKGSKMRSKSLYHLPFLRYLHFKYFYKISRWPPKLKILKIFIWSHDINLIPFRDQNLVKNALSLIVFEIFHFIYSTIFN